jgi:dihydrolipoamide dehydrogenase
MFDVIVIGSGPGGYVAAIRCAQLGFKTACVEKDKTLGGTCLNVGCIPSKALLHSSELFASLGTMEAQGIAVPKGATPDFSKMMARKAKIVSEFNQGVAYLFKKNQITHIQGAASLDSPTTVLVEGKSYTAKYIILATGSEPIALPFLPFDEKKVLSSTGALGLSSIPKKLLVVGAGVIGVELGSVYKRLGSEVLFIEFLERICPTLDEAVSKSFQEILEKQGLQFRLSSKVVGAQVTDVAQLRVETAGKQEIIAADAVLVCIGRRPYTKGLALEKAGIKPNEKGFIPIDGQFRTACPTIFAIGDIVDGPMLAHKASEEGIAVAEILAGHTPILEYMAIPSVVYTHPEAAAVGLTEKEARALGLQIETGSFPFSVNSRAKCTGETEGFVKVIAEASTKRLLGIHILGAHASELIGEAALAIGKKLTVQEVAELPHAHPTLSEALKEAALALLKRAIHK